VDTNALNTLIARRNQLAQEIERLLGRRDQAQKNLAETESESRSKGIDPDKIDQILKELLDRYHKRVPELEAKLAQCAEILAQYTTKVTR